MSNYLAVRRKELGLTMKDVADAVGVSEATVSRWESGAIANMRRDRIHALAKVLNVSPTFVMSGKEDDPSVKIIDEENNTIVLDDDALALIDSLRARPEMKMLFSVSKNATTEDILKAVKIIEALKDN